MTKKVLVWGKQGFIGSHLPYEGIKERAYPNLEYLRNTLISYRPNVVINTIGYCGIPNIDQCLENKEKTILTNTVLPLMMATECNAMGIKFIHISSGCIYNGSSPHTLITGDMAHPIKTDTGFTEEDFANPPSFYATSKYSCDLAFQSLPNVCALRIRMPVSSQASPRNLITKLRGYQNIINAANSMTMVSDLVRCISWCIDHHKTGIYNVVNPEPLTAVNIMNEYQKYYPTHQFNIISLKQLSNLTKDGRSNCILDGHKLKNAGFEMTPSKQALELTMKEYAKNMEHNE